MSERSDNRARWVNLLVPGAGLVLAGQVWLGCVTGALFIFLINFVVAAFLLFPDDVSRGWRDFCSVLTIGAYVVSQLRLAQHLRRRAATRQQAARRAALARAQESLDAGNAAAAVAALEALADGAAPDLLLAVRRAQALSALPDSAAARAAWEHVGQLDRHHIYRALRRRELEALRVRGSGQADDAGQRERVGR